jgi:nicotinate phosphoribosyltransferase
MAGDRTSLVETSIAAPADEALVQPVMRDGRRVAPAPSLDDIRARAKRDLERLPEPLRKLEQGASYPVEIGEDLIKLADAIDSRLR